MKIIQNFMTKNDCFLANQKIIPQGIMIHSTATPGIMSGEWFERWNKSYRSGEILREVCVHAFLDDEQLVQYLPWDHRGWHAGGSANNTHIGIELCEPSGHTYFHGAQMDGYDVSKNEAYFFQIYENAIELCTELCLQFNLSEKDIIAHCEGHIVGVASNHADVMHWFVHHGVNMNTFRERVGMRLRLRGKE